ncbi:MAG: hypothetical protein NVSMB33_04480 [Ktedonobacteraceae bacterium]
MSNKQLRFLTFMLATLAIGSILLVACARPGSTSSTTNNGNNQGSGNNGSPNTVHMGAVNFLEATVSIAKGSKLTLIDDVAVPHIIKNGMWDASGAQKPLKEPGAPAVNQNFAASGESHDIGPFATAGTYHIFCTIHTNMNLTITVK